MLKSAVVTFSRVLGEGGEKPGEFHSRHVFIHQHYPEWVTKITTSLLVRTRAMSHEGALTEWVSAENPLTFQRLGQGFVGLGQALRLSFSGPARFAEASAAWKELVASAQVDDPVGVPGSGLICFGTFAFSDTSSHESVLIVPQVIIGRLGSTSWRTDISLAGEGTAKSSSRGSSPADFAPLQWRAGLVSEDDYVSSVTAMIGQVQDGVADKVVLARDLVAHAPGMRDWRGAISRLTEAYPDCQTFAIDGFVGSTPETLARVDRGRLGVRVLAGSIARGSNPSDDRGKAQELITSAKDNDEHRYAVNSIMDSLQALTPHAVADEQPFTVKLANVWHLATDIEAKLPESVSSLDVVAALHPSAAVAGSPTDVALDLISRHEPFDRGRYAGPVGWMDASGDGEWSVALRCAQWSPEGTLTAYAGAGIVAESDPQSELLETRLKFKPIISAFGGEGD